MRIHNGDVGLHLEVDGADDAPPILLLHGILGCSGTWGWIVPRLVDRYRLIRLDFRGHGESDRAAGRYQSTEYMSDAIAACEQVAAAPCVVIGHSLGGVTAAALAQQRPDLVRGVVLEDAPLGRRKGPAPGERSDSLLDAFVRLREAIPRMQAAGTSIDAAIAATATAPSASGPLFGQILHDDGVRSMALATLAVDASVLDAVLGGDAGWVYDRDAEIPVPVAVVAADPASPDVVTRPTDLEQIRAVNPHATVRTLHGANHLIHDTVGQREPFWAIVETFLTSLGD